MTEAQEAKPWKTRMDVERLTVGKRELGKGIYGTVFAGRLKLQGQKPKQVAVKVFNDSTPTEFFGREEFDSEVVRHYEQAIEKLRKANVPLLKTGFVQYNGKYVQVQELYQASQRSKIMDYIDYDESHPGFAPLNEKEGREQLLQIISGIINAGLTPHPDTIGIVKTSKGNRLVVHDLDFLAHINYLKTKEKHQPAVKSNLEQRLRIWQDRFHSAGIAPKEFLSELKQRIKTEEGLSLIKKMEQTFLDLR